MNEWKSCKDVPIGEVIGGLGLQHGLPFWLYDGDELIGVFRLRAEAEACLRDRDYIKAGNVIERV